MTQTQKKKHKIAWWEIICVKTGLIFVLPALFIQSSFGQIVTPSYSAICEGSTVTYTVTPPPTTNFTHWLILYQGDYCYSKQIPLPAIITGLPTIDLTTTVPPLEDTWYIIAGQSGFLPFTTPTTLKQGTYNIHWVMCYDQNCNTFTAPVYPASLYVRAEPSIENYVVTPQLICGTSGNVKFSGVVPYGCDFTLQKDGSLWQPSLIKWTFNVACPETIVEWWDYNVTATTTYTLTVTEGFGVCPPKTYTTTVKVVTLPNDLVLNIKPHNNDPPLVACVEPYPAKYCRWLPICSGCDAVLTLEQNYLQYVPPADVTVTWEKQEAPFNCDVDPDCAPVFTFGTDWSTTNHSTNPEFHTNILTTTTYYRVTISCGDIPNDKVLHAVVVVIDPPVFSSVSSPSLFVDCPAPQPHILNAASNPVKNYCNPIDWQWTGPGGLGPSGSNIPITPFQTYSYGTYKIDIRNDCGSASAEFNVVPEICPTVILGPCCVCEGGCPHLVAYPLDGCEVVSWASSSTDPDLQACLATANATHESSITCCIHETTTFSLTVESPLGCQQTVYKTVKICPTE